MFVDGRAIDQDEIRQYDLCIVGSGPAGISIAREFIGRDESVCVLESGGLRFDSETQSLAAGEETGQPFFTLVSIVLRYFGGTSNHWAGNCFPLSSIAMGHREWVDAPAWPVSLERLMPFYHRAQELIGLPEDPWDLSHWLMKMGGQVLPLKAGPLEPVPVQIKPQRFGQVYREELEQASNVHVHLWSNLTELETDVNAATVRRARVKCLNGRTFAVQARRFVLASGGVENARLLLLSNGARPTGLGNEHDQVGRFFMDHPRLVAGELHPQVDARPSRAFLTMRNGQDKVAIQYRLSEKAQTERRTTQSAVALRPISPEWFPDRSQSLPIMSNRQILRNIKHARVPDDFGKHLANVFSDPGEVSRYVYGDLRYGDDQPVDHYRCYVRFEPNPNPESRVTLSERVDALGMRRAKLNWALADRDRHTVRETMRALTAQVGRSGYGHVRSFVEEEEWGWPSDTLGGRHEMGTTRISEDPTQGVVNQDCRVHGVDNLYIAGSSVFPTVGSGWPTMTLIAMALRLADHLKQSGRVDEVESVSPAIGNASSVDAPVRG